MLGNPRTSLNCLELKVSKPRVRMSLSQIYGFQGVFAFDLLGVLLGMKSRTNWYQNFGVWLWNKGFEVERIMSRLLLKKWLSQRCPAWFCAFWMKGIESWMMKTRSLFKRGSILDHKVNFSSYKPVFHICSRLIMLAMIMQKCLCFMPFVGCIMMNHDANILPKMWRCAPMIIVFSIHYSFFILFHSW